MVTKTASDPTVVFQTHLTSLGKSRNRWCVLIPPAAVPALGKKTNYEIAFTPIGSIKPVRILPGRVLV